MIWQTASDSAIIKNVVGTQALVFCVFGFFGDALCVPAEKAPSGAFIFSGVLDKNIELWYMASYNNT